MLEYKDTDLWRKGPLLRVNVRENGRELIRSLVEKFRDGYRDYTLTSSGYNESQTRIDFIDPFLNALGWDVVNRGNAQQHLREVVVEDTVEVEEEDGTAQKKPDYALRVGGRPKFYLEAKKPSVPIGTARQWAYQVRRYGWSARLPVSVLMNFDHLVIYDCLLRPMANDDVRVARVRTYDYTEYETKFDEIYDLLSRESVYSGKFDEEFGREELPSGTEPFDQYFLEQIEGWRERLAENLVSRNPGLAQEDLSFLVQRFINRVIFLRMCEDRELERYEALKNVESYDELKTLFVRADERYNSDLFNFIEDQLSLRVTLDDSLLIQIFQELYYPNSPYAFSVIDASILGQVYELFLGKGITVNDTGVEVVEKPEVVESGGVVSTPEYIVDDIIRRTLSRSCQDRSPDELASLRLADIACGSGVFLISAFEYLMNYHREWYIRDGAERHRERVFEGANGEWHLTLHEKRRILTNCIYAVDLDIQAVEVARFGLLLKLLENESAAAIDAYLRLHSTRALPNLSENIKWGNSLVDSTFLRQEGGRITTADDFAKINAFDWRDGFPTVMREGGFDVIVGNPPYIRIQNMAKYSPLEVEYYRGESSPYESGRMYNMDKYYIFVERALSLLKPTGFLGYILPHKFFTITSGVAPRKLITSGRYLADIVHFGVQQVFWQTTTYTCILVLRRGGADEVTVTQVGNIGAWLLNEDMPTETYSADEFGEDPWVFAPPEARALFARLHNENPRTLEDLAHIFVGVQTSDDDIYILRATSETDEVVRFLDIDDVEREVEKSILRSCLYDVSLEGFERPQPNRHIIFPYQMVGKKAQPYSEQDMRNSFPLCWEYLSAHKERLLGRSIQPFTEDTWYRYGRSQSLTKFDGSPNLIWPVLTLRPCYSYDDQNTVFTGGGNGPYYALRPRNDGSSPTLEGTQFSLYYLMALLAHPVMEAMVFTRTSTFRGNYYSHGKQFVKGLPIREIDQSNAGDAEAFEAIVDFVGQLLNATEAKQRADTPHRRQLNSMKCVTLKRRIDELVESLYGISAQDLEAVASLRASED